MRMKLKLKRSVGRKHLFTRCELRLSLAFFLILGAFLVLCYHTLQMHRTVRFYQQIYSNTQISITPQK